MKTLKVLLFAMLIMPIASLTNSQPNTKVVIGPSIDIEKYVWEGAVWPDADSPTGPYLTSAQNPVVFKFTIHNTGNVALTDVDLTDTDMSTFYTDEACTSVATFPTTLAVDETKIFYGKLAWAAGQHADTATADGVSPVDSDVSDNDPAHYFGEEEQTQGCGHGFWANNVKRHGAVAWFENVGWNMPSALWSTAFGLIIAIDDNKIKDNDQETSRSRRRHRSIALRIVHDSYVPLFLDCYYKVQVRIVNCGNYVFFFEKPLRSGGRGKSEIFAGA